MNYSAYYKLALQQVYGVEFPEMSSAEFDSRCTLSQVPDALKSLYLVLGQTRVCRMHVFLPVPEELCVDGCLVRIAQADNGTWFIDSKDLHEKNPLVQVITKQKEDTDGTLISEFGNDGETRVALLMANLIAQSAEETRKACASAHNGLFNRFRSIFSWLTRRRLRFLTLMALVVIYPLITTRILVKIDEISPTLGSLGVFFTMGLFLVPVLALWRVFLYWNVWLGWNDNVRFVNGEDPLCLLINKLTLEYLFMNQAERWALPGKGDFHLDWGICLREGDRRYCQVRYDLILESDGEICFPGFAPIRYEGEKQLSLLLRSTLDKQGCLSFVRVEAGRKWKLPKSGKVRLRETESPMTSPKSVPIPLQNIVRRKCAECPAIRMAWLRPAIEDGVSVYRLTVLANADVNLAPLLEDVLKFSDRPLNASIQDRADDMEKFIPLFSRGTEAVNNDIPSEDHIRINEENGEITIGEIIIRPDASPQKIRDSYGAFIVDQSANLPWERIYLVSEQYHFALYFNDGKLTMSTLTCYVDGKWVYGNDKVQALYDRLFPRTNRCPYWSAYFCPINGHMEPPSIHWKYTISSPAASVENINEPHPVVRKMINLQAKALCLAPLVLIFALLWPVNNWITRWLIVLGSLGVLAEIALAAGWLYRKSKTWFFVFIATLSILIGWSFGTALYSTPLYDRLRSEYVLELRKYVGTRYLWGGENRLGIDCSGLPRKAMRTAFWKIGLNEGNRDFHFRALENWWFDASAKALAEGYRDYVFPLNVSGTVAGGPTYFLEPGDLAITDDGVHVMVYLGPDEWISADPGQGKVVIEHPSESKNPWFTRPVHFYRFSALRNARFRPMRTFPAIAWESFLKGSQSGCCLDTSDTYTENAHWNIFISSGEDFCLHFLSEKLTSKRPTGQRMCGYPVMNEGEVALVSMARISGKSLLEYNGSDAAVKKIIADSKSYAAPLFYVMPEVLKTESTIAAVREYYLESPPESEAKP